MAVSPGTADLLEVRPISGGRGRIVCVANQKGGVAKTTTTVNLATGLALRGHRVLVVDLDPQANAGTGLGIDRASVAVSTYDVLVRGRPWRDALVSGPVTGLDVLPSSLDLAGAEIELVSEMARERTLAGVLGGDAEPEGVTACYDMVLLDCPPSLGLLTVNALVAARDLLVPVQCEYYALEGLGQLVGTADRVRRGLNPDLRIAGFLMTMYDGRTKLAAQVVAEVRKHFPGFVFETLIPRSVRLSEAPSFGEPVLTLDPSSRGSVAYRLLAAEVERRYELPVHVPPPPGTTPQLSGATPPAAPPPPAPGAPARGPGGRGYGVRTARPEGLERAWPPPVPWGGS